MATLVPTRKGWMQHAGESYTDYFARLEAVMKTFPQATDKPVVGMMIQFPVADNYARYVVKSLDPLELEHFPIFDGYSVHPALIRGLIVEDLQHDIDMSREFRKLFRQ
jgi:hypothetical protein